MYWEILPEAEAVLVFACHSVIFHLLLTEQGQLSDQLTAN